MQYTTKLRGISRWVFVDQFWFDDFCSFHLIFHSSCSLRDKKINWPHHKLDPLKRIWGLIFQKEKRQMSYLYLLTYLHMTKTKASRICPISVDTSYLGSLPFWLRTRSIPSTKRTIPWTTRSVYLTKISISRTRKINVVTSVHIYSWLVYRSIDMNDICDTICYVSMHSLVS